MSLAGWVAEVVVAGAPIAAGAAGAPTTPAPPPLPPSGFRISPNPSNAVLKSAD